MLPTSREKRIISDYESGLSLDVIIGRYLNKRCDNRDDITKVIKDHQWNQWKNKSGKR